MKKIILRIDSRDLIHSEHFGSVTTIPASCNFEANLSNPIEAAGAENCTAIADTSVACDQTKIVYDVNDLWNQVPNNSQGTDPRTTLSIMVSQGLLPIGQTVRDTRWKSYFRGDLGPSDSATNVMTTMTVAQSSITVCTPWYNNFDSMEQNSVMPQGDYQVSNHDWKITGWQEINGVTMFICKAWLGYVFYCPLSVFNWLMGQTGSQTWMPATAQIMALQQRTLIEWLIDLCTNAVLLLKEKMLLSSS